MERSVKKGIWLKQIGITSDSKPVVCNVYKFHETYGLPLTDILYGLKKLEISICWRSLLDEAVAAGMKKERALSKISESIQDVYDFEYCDKVIQRLNQ